MNSKRKIVQTYYLDLSPRRNYWLVRTDSGTWYEEFSKEDYVAIGWDEVKEDKMFSLDNKDKAIAVIEELYPDNSAGRWTRKRVDFK